MYNEAFLQAVIENAIDGIIVIDENGLILSVNPSACSLFGYPVRELCGKNVNILMPYPDSDRHDGYLRQYGLSHEAHIIGIGREVNARRKDGSVFPARLAVSEIRHQGKQAYVGIINDISNEKEIELGLLEYNNKLEALVEEKTRSLQNTVQSLEQAKAEVNASLKKEVEVNQLKTRFVSIASHEFRTPLSNIQLSASLIERYYDRLERQKIFLHLQKIKSGVNHLTAILNDFLSVERIEAGKVTPKYQQFDLISLCEDIVEAMKMQAKKEQQIDYEHSGKTTLINSDPILLQHCLVNLISNAIKYTRDDGAIKLKTRVTNTRYNISVTDNGMGIPESEQQHLFEPFFRAQNTIDIQGTGLGLNIVKRYTNLMDGDISFKSVENKGSVFNLTFPQRH